MSRLRLALATVPTREDWLFALGLLLVFAGLALPLGLFSGVLRPEGEPWPRLLLFAVVAVLVPCLGEELAFRAALLPHPSEKRRAVSVIGWSALGVALFVAWHPLNAALFLPRAWHTFSDPRFLALAGLLGACCTAAYLRSGSLWPAVALHWAAVVAWKGWLGGAIVLL